MTWPVSPTEPAGPSGRRCPTPNRRISIGMACDQARAGRLAATALASAALPATATPAGATRRSLALDRGVRVRVLARSHVTVLGELRLVRPEERWEAEEPDP